MLLTFIIAGFIAALCMLLKAAAEYELQFPENYTTIEAHSSNGKLQTVTITRNSWNPFIPKEQCLISVKNAPITTLLDHKTNKVVYLK